MHNNEYGWLVIGFISISNKQWEDLLTPSPLTTVEMSYLLYKWLYAYNLFMNNLNIHSHVLGIKKTKSRIFVVARLLVLMITVIRPPSLSCATHRLKRKLKSKSISFKYNSAPQTHACMPIRSALVSCSLAHNKFPSNHRQQQTKPHM